MHRRDRQLILFCLGMFVCALGATMISVRGGNGLYFGLLVPSFMWPFGMRH